MFCDWSFSSRNDNDPKGRDDRPTILDPRGRSQAPSGVNHNTASGDYQHRPFPGPGFLLPVALVASTAYILKLRRARVRRQMAGMYSARHRAHGAAKAWQQAFMAVTGNKPVTAPRKPAQDLHRPKSDPSRLPGGFLDPAVARQAKREELEDVGPLYSDFGPTFGRFNSLIHGNEVEPDHATSPAGAAVTSSTHPPEQQTAGKAGTPPGAWPAQPKVLNAHFNGSIAPKDTGSEYAVGLDHSSTFRPKVKELTPRERWQRAFGPGHAAVANDHEGWEQLAKMAAARQSQAPPPGKKDFDAYPELASSAEPQSTGPSTKASKAKAKPEVKVNDALHAELDELLLSQHREKDSRKKSAAAEAQEQDTSSCAAQGSSSLRSGQHVSMDNLFLDSQLAQAAEEGREARLAREARDSALGPRESKREVVSSPETPSREFGGDGNDFNIDDLSATLLNRKPDEASPKEGQDASSLQSDQIATAQEEPVRRRPGRPRLVPSDDAPAKKTATKSRAKKDNTQQASRLVLEDESMPRRLVMEPEDLDEALVHFREPAQDPAQVEAERLFREEAENAEVQDLRRKVAEMEATMAEIRVAMSQMGVWGDEVHRRLGLKGSCPTSPDKPK